MTDCLLRTSTVEIEGEYKCAKWLHHAVLFSESELEDFLSCLGPCFFLPLAEPVSQGSWCVRKEVVIDRYREYLEMVRNQSDLPSSTVRRFFSLGLTSSLEDVYALPLSGDRIFIKPCRPIVQVQLYRCYFSAEKKFHPMILHPNSFSFGLQFSYPQIYEDPHTHQFSKVLQDVTFSNTKVYKNIVSWIRSHTKPFTVVADGIVIPAPFRVGKGGEDPLSYHLGLKRALA